MRFDGPLLARAWLSVSAAASTDKDHPVLYKTVGIQEYPTGVRLTATDMFVMLAAWVPDLEHHYDTDPPPLDEAPLQIVGARDTDGRARSFLGYVLSMYRRIEPEYYTPGDLEARIDFDVRLPAGSGPQEALDGMDPTYVVLSTPDVEKVYLESSSTFPDARAAMQPKTRAPLDRFTVNTEHLERLGRIRKHVGAPMRLDFHGADNAHARLAFLDADPPVTGLITRYGGDPHDEVDEP